MKHSSSSSRFLLSLLPTIALAQPSSVVQRDDYGSIQVAHLVFHGGPASYSLDVPTDGSPVETCNDISVSIIDTPDYNAFDQCAFYTDNDVAFVTSIAEDGTQQIIVGPPQPIRTVRCWGTCVPTYGDCYDSHGDFVGPCCAGYCAGNKCHPWRSGE